MNHVYLNGQVIPEDDARISVFDAGFAHAAGLFETMRAYRGVVMRLDQHIGRLLHSAAALELHIPVESGALAEAVMEALRANDLRDARLRLLVTPGEVPRAGQPGDRPSQPTVLVTASAVRPHPREEYKAGWRVCISPYKTNRMDPLAGHKTLAYLPRLMAMREAAGRRCNESLWFTTENQLAEGSVSNVFIVMNGTVLTPPTSTPVLPGTVRGAVMELAEANGIPCEEKEIDINLLLAAQELFLTGSVLEVMPVTSIEKHVVGDGAPGVVTKRMMDLYQTLVQKECGT